MTSYLRRRRVREMHICTCLFSASSPDKTSRTPNDLQHCSRIYLEGGLESICESEIEFWSLLCSPKVKVHVHAYTVERCMYHNLKKITKMHHFKMISTNYNHLLKE